ncbi:MAG: DNA polymerase/3'-5' exonuclease PolX [Verrucomicrobia bacterium]|nr:DNA polymerase/3'-5' exonuclease PolX [Verrucomicrobiota bacterium]
MDKSQIAKIFEEIAVLLELKGENPFRIRAYRNAARTILNLESDLEERVRQGTLTELEGIGDDLADKIKTMVLKGRLPFYEKLKKSIPTGVLDMMQVHGLGGKKIKMIYEKLKIKSIAALKEACEKGKLSRLKGFGPKTEQNILDSLEHMQTYQKRRCWWEAMQIAAPILDALRKLKGVRKVEIAGSMRRKMETIGDLDFLVGSSNPGPIMKWFTTQPFVARVLGKGETKASVKLEGGMQADLRIVPEKQYGFALAYFTGSKEHNIEMRQRAIKRGWTLSEYGLNSVNQRRKGPFASAKKPVTEKEIFHALGLSYIEPELRENCGEFEAGEKHRLPILVKETDIRGAFHNHTTASDGRSSLKEMVAAAQKLRWEYIGIADHSKSSFQANGLSEERLMKQLTEIRRLNASKQFRPYIFAGVECDILPNGALDFPDRVLKKLDYVVISVHNALSQDEKTMTKRIIRAIENPYSTMLGHATGRLLLRREPYKVNLNKVIDACIANNKIIELNGNPMRLDMDWRLWHAASEKGLMCCINPDAHHTDHLQFYRAGVNIARKGWLEKEDVLNTRPLKQVQKFLKEMRT